MLAAMRITAPRPIAGIAVAALLALGAVALAPAGAKPPAAGPGAEAEAAGKIPTPKRAKLRLRNSPYGKVIFEVRSGLVAYLFTSDGKNRSACYGACAKAWPPIKTRKRPAAGSGLNRKHLRTVKRRGGGKMVTYKGVPLYFYAHENPGEILCHDVFSYGGDWFVVKKNGKRA